MCGLISTHSPYAHLCEVHSATLASLARSPARNARIASIATYRSIHPLATLKAWAGVVETFEAFDR